MSRTRKGLLVNLLLPAAMLIGMSVAASPARRSPNRGWWGPA